MTALARGRSSSTGITSSAVRDLERNAAGQPVKVLRGRDVPTLSGNSKVVAYTDKDGGSHLILVTHNSKGKARTHDLKTDPATARKLAKQVDKIAADLDVDRY